MTAPSDIAHVKWFQGHDESSPYTCIWDTSSKVILVHLGEVLFC